MMQLLFLLFYIINFFMQTNCNSDKRTIDDIQFTTEGKKLEINETKTAYAADRNNLQISKTKTSNDADKRKLQMNETSYDDKSNSRFKRANYENYTEKVIQMGDEAGFPCYIEKENTTVLWVKVDKNTNNELNITVNYTTVHIDKRFKQMKQNGSKNWQLSIKYTQKSDEGLYLCKSTSNPVTKMYYELILIEAIARILDTDEKETGIIRVKLFSPLRLSCVLYNSISPPLYIFWYHYDTMINYDLEDNASVRHGRQGSELIFPKTEARHQGNYSCVPSNARQASIVVDVHGEIKKATSKGRTVLVFKEIILSIYISILFNFFYLW